MSSDVRNYGTYFERVNMQLISHKLKQIDLPSSYKRPLAIVLFTVENEENVLGLTD